MCRSRLYFLVFCLHCGEHVIEIEGDYTELAEFFRKQSWTGDYCYGCEQEDVLLYWEQLVEAE